jgi:hypothetical protein
MEHGLSGVASLVGCLASPPRSTPGMVASAGARSGVVCARIGRRVRGRLIAAAPARWLRTCNRENMSAL